MRFTEIENGLQKVDDHQDEQEHENAALWDGFEKLQAGLALAEVLVPPPTAPIYAPEFSRAIDTTNVKINVAFDVCKNPVHDSLLAALGAVADAAWALEGDEIGKRFVIQF